MNFRRGIRCQNSISRITTVQKESLSNKRKVRQKKLSTNVINVTSDAVTDQIAKVKLLTSSTRFENDTQHSDLLKMFYSSVDNTDFSSDEFKEDALSITGEKLAGLNGETNVCDVPIVEMSENYHNENVVLITKTNENSTSINGGGKNNKDPSSKTVKTKKKKKQGLSSENFLNLVDQMKYNSKIFSFNCNLEAFLSVCSNGDACLLESGLKKFLYFANKGNALQKISDIKVYNEALKCLENLNEPDIDIVTSHLHRAAIKPDVNTFAHIFSCLGRHPPSPSNQSKIAETLNWMEKEGISVEDMYYSALFPGTTLKYCTEALKRMDSSESDEVKLHHLSMDSIPLRNCYDNRLLNSINDSFFSSKTPPPSSGVATADELEDYTKEQFELETKGFSVIPSIFTATSREQAETNVKQLELWEEEWRSRLQQVIDSQKSFKEKTFYRSFKRQTVFDIYPYYANLDTESLVNLIILEIHKLCSGLVNSNVSMDHLYFALGCQVYKLYLINYKKRSGYIDHLKKVYAQYRNWHIHSSTPPCSYNPRIQWDIIISQTGNNLLRDCPPEWPYPVKKSFGQMLYSILFLTVKVYDPKSKERTWLPAFNKIYRQEADKTTVKLEISPHLSSVFKMTEKKNIIFTAEDLPMIVPPLPWTNPKCGGYLLTQTEFIRHVPYAHLQKKRVIESKSHIFPVMDSLNQLASVPWRINTEMLDFIIKLFNESGWEELDLCPPKPSCKEPSKYDPSMTDVEKRIRRYELYKYKKKVKENYSVWCDTLYKLSLANYFRDHVIWLPQNIDFRGRTYPIPPHLTHLSSDLFRSTLLFAQGKPLGKDGLKLLKLHIINLSGIKKRCSIQDRLDYANEVLDLILDSADNPVGGNKWWTNSEEPWQTLASCKELARALRSSNPGVYVSHLPIHQDGSCNGLQHYAALGRDKLGAKSVNLSPSLVPQDIYSDVLAFVECKRRQDAENGVDIAKSLEGFLSRKVIKQTIMTTVYGVTEYGAKLQIARQLRYLNFTSSKVNYAALYLARTTFQSLGELFNPTQKIQTWLVKCADGLSHMCLQNVEWVTPLGFPVVQPYTKVKTISKTSRFPSQIPLHFANDSFAVPNRLKQKNAFPPNFIHSLDASHMMLTSIFCQHAGICFISIHDCFWTHACTVPMMSKICREQFVKLHSLPILEDLSQFLVDRLREHKMLCSTDESESLTTVSLNKFEKILREIPPKGQFDLGEVMDSIFFFC